MSILTGDSLVIFWMVMNSPKHARTAVTHFKPCSSWSKYMLQLRKSCKRSIFTDLDVGIARRFLADNLNSLHATGTFMCPCNTSALCDRHIYVPADAVQSYGVNSEAKRAFGVNPCLLSSNKCRPRLSTYITPRGRQEGAVLGCDRL